MENLLKVLHPIFSILEDAQRLLPSLRKTITDFIDKKIGTAKRG
jgi:hypothetical protein